MEGNFNMRKIHAGYVVEFRNGQRAMAMRYDNGNMAPNLFFVIPGMHRGYGRLSDWYADTMNRATMTRRTAGNWRRCKRMRRLLRPMRRPRSWRPTSKRFRKWPSRRAPPEMPVPTTSLT